MKDLGLTSQLSGGFSCLNPHVCSALRDGFITRLRTARAAGLCQWRKASSRACGPGRPRM